MPALLSFHKIAAQRGDGFLPELVAFMERPIPRLAQPIDALSPQLTYQFTEIVARGEKNSE